METVRYKEGTKELTVLNPDYVVKRYISLFFIVMSFIFNGQFEYRFLKVKLLLEII